MTPARVPSARITVQRRALASRLRVLALAAFVAGAGLSIPFHRAGTLALVGVAVAAAFLVWARRVSGGARAFVGALEISPGEVAVLPERGARVVVTGVRTGWVVPGAAGARVELVRDDDDAVTADVASPEEGHAALAAAGVDPSRRAVRLLLGGRWDGVGFGVVTALFVLLQGTPVFLLLALSLGLSGPTTVALGLGLLALATGVGGRMLGPAEVTLGADGVRWRHGFSRGYAAWRDVSGVEAWHDQGILLRRRGSAPVIIPHAQRDGGRLAGVVALLRRVWERAAESPRAPLEALDRRGRTLADWREALRALLASAAYRQGSVTPDDLAATLVDPAASAERRLAAAMCLHDAGAPGAATRIRVAAEACASDDLRAALERAAEGDVDEATAARVAGR
ncbi:MAG: hypothetical protein U0324_18965 [Polyangiales bacterium]